MNPNPKCEVCGRDMVERNDTGAFHIRRWFECPATPDQHRIAELESKLAAAEAQVKALTAERDESDFAMSDAWGWLGADNRKLRTRSIAAFQVVLAREASKAKQARAALKGESHE